MDDVNKFYHAQKTCRDNDAVNKERINHTESWLRDDTVDYWRHQRMHRFIDPFLDLYPDSKWLTIGDGRFASEAQYIRRKAKDVTASDISEGMLLEAKNRNLIDKYSIENAEKLSFTDSSFDFILCKESYHHFPRPIIALYEMIRVARKAVILIEPNDSIFEELWRAKNVLDRGSFSFSDIARALLKRTGLLNLSRRLRKLKINPIKYCNATFEISGNFVYAVSKIEIAKVALGIGLPTIAFAGINDYYEYGVEFEKAAEDSELFRKVKNKIEKINKTNKSGIIIAVIFKVSPEENLRRSMRDMQFEIVDVPTNPYLQASSPISNS